MPDLPVSYLFDSSKQSLQEYELSRLNHASNIKKQLRILLEQLIDESVDAQFARWMLEHREELRFRSVSLEVKQDILDFSTPK
jgi:hypothetical protein